MDIPSIDAKLAEFRDRGDCDLSLSSRITSEFICAPPYRVGVAHLMLKPRFLLADPVGTGKTPQALVAYGLLLDKAQKPIRLLVLTPKAALFQWQKAVAKFLTGVEATVVAGPAAKRAEQWQSGTLIHITTYATAARDLETLLPALETFFLILDEVQTLKGPAQTFLRPAALKLALKARYAWGLSATPNTGKLTDLYSIMEVVRPGIFGSSLNKFLNTYLDRVWVRLGKTGRGFWHVKGTQNLDDLMTRMRPYYLRRPAHVMAQHLPEVVFQEVDLDLEPAQREIYRHIVTQYLPPAGERVEGKQINKITSLSYAQMASDAPEVLGFEDAGSSKFSELLRFLDEDVSSEDKIVIYTRYEKVLTWIQYHLPVPCVRISGKESAEEREQARVSFLTGTENIMLITSAGGQALDLQAARILVFFDLPWSWGEFQQVLGRIRRIGSPHDAVLAIFLKNAGTIDDYTLDILRDKEGLVGDTLGLDDQGVLSADRQTIDRLYEALRHSTGAADRAGGPK
jgi:SNF2 family DNA or RNA helicase